MRRPLVLLWFGIVLPFVLTIINGGPDGWLPHVLFHPVYIGFLVVGVWGTRALRRATESRAARWLAGGVAVLAVLSSVGHAGEFAAVLANGGVSADETVFQTTLHRWSASITVPALLLAIVLVLAVTVVSGLAGRRRSTGTAVNRWVRTVHRWVSFLFVLALVAVLAFQDVAALGVAAAVSLGVLLVTGLQMSGRHYLVRWRRGARRTGAAGPLTGPGSARTPAPTPSL